jgi:hypothetical protein
MMMRDEGSDLDLSSFELLMFNSFSHHCCDVASVGLAVSNNRSGLPAENPQCKKYTVRYM